MAKQKYLTAAEEASYGRFEAQAPEQAVLERFFFLDDADLDLVAKRRGDYNRLGFMERRPTRFEHQAEIADVYGYVSYASAEAELIGWLDGQAWTTGDQPKPLFYAAVGWLRVAPTGLA